MSRSASLLVLLLLVAGCNGPASDVAGTDSPTLTPAPTPAFNETSTDAASTPADIMDVNTVEYADLSSNAQTAFDAAVENEATFLPDSPYVEDEHFDPDVSEEFHDVEYVRKNGTTYALSRHTGKIYASYYIHARPGSPGEDATVVAYETLSSDVSSEVEGAIENETHHVPLGKWNSLPDELGDARYVRYDGETYRLSYAVADTWVTVMRARQV